VIRDDGAPDIGRRGIPHAQSERDLGGRHHLGMDAAHDAGDTRQLIGRHGLGQAMAVQPPSDRGAPREHHDPMMADGAFRLTRRS